MIKIFQEIREKLNLKQDVVLVTIIAGSGSTPRGAGARMMVSTDGSCSGTIGGGNVEHEAFLKAKELLKEKSSLSYGYNLGGQEVANIGMVCGGAVVVYFQYMNYEDEKNRQLCNRILEQCEKKEDAWLIMDISQKAVWSMGVYTKAAGLPEMEVKGVEALLKPRAIRVELEGKLYYAEPLVKGGTVYVFGGGHVAQELVPVLSHLDFQCVVFDDREEFANPTVFQTAEKTIVSDFTEISKKINICQQDYVVIMTRGHQYDYEIQAQVLPLHPCYIGIMGSHHKIAYITKKLLEDGFTREEIERCHMPIGTAIDAETPAEIAISVAGELIQIRALRNGTKNE